MNMRTVFTWLLVTTFACTNVFAQDKLKELDAKLKELAARNHLPGFSVAIVNKDGVLYQNGYGYADLKSKRPYTKNTIQNIGSISKTFIGVSLMKAVEQGKIKLDDDINSILPFKITNPYHPKATISVRHLATHTSTLKDTDNYERTYIFKKKISVDPNKMPDGYMKYIDIYNTNKRMPMADFIKNLVTEKGEWYNKENFLKQKPGTTTEYSNLGATILAYILELKTGESFADYSRKHILEPLKMNDSGLVF